MEIYPIKAVLCTKKSLLKLRIYFVITFFWIYGNCLNLRAFAAEVWKHHIKHGMLRYQWHRGYLVWGKRSSKTDFFPKLFVRQPWSYQTMLRMKKSVQSRMAWYSTDEKIIVPGRPIFKFLWWHLVSRAWTHRTNLVSIWCLAQKCECVCLYPTELVCFLVS